MKHYFSWPMLAFLAIGWSTADAVPDLGTITGDPTYNGLLDTGEQQFGLSDLDGIDDDSGVFFVLEAAGNAASNELFMYDLADTSNRLTIFAGADTAGDSVILSYDLGTNTWDNGTSSAMFISMAEFGLGLDGPGGVFFSEDALNPNGSRQVGIFDTESAGGLLGAFEKTVAWEDLPLLSSDGDYNDAVYALTDVIAIQQVPSPGPIGLVGLGLLAIGLLSAPGRR